MSALGGIFSRHGEPVEKALLRRLASEMTQLGPDGESYDYRDSVGMLLRPFITHHEVRRAMKPTVNDDGFMITFDGWLDNRDEVLALLGPDWTPQTRTDPELALAIYRQSGVSGFANLIGAFAMAIWDPDQERLYLVADSLGFRPLYVHLDTDRAVWSSRARALIVACGLPVEIDTDYVAAYLNNTVSPKSPYCGIQVVSGGHFMCVDRDSVRLERYWAFDPSHEIRYSDDRDYEEHFRELFTESVACRMRSEGPVFAELSGGVDSSSIVCVANGLLKEGRFDDRHLHSISYVFGQALSADERPYIEKIQSFVNCKSHHLSEEEHAILSKRPPVDFQPDFPSNQICYLARYDHVSQLLEASGSRVLLGGIGGDQAFLSEGVYLPILEVANLYAQRRPLALLRTGNRWARTMRVPFLRILWASLVQAQLKGWQARMAPPNHGDWFKSSFVNQSKFVERSRGPRDDLGFFLPSNAFQYTRLINSMRLFALNTCVSQGHFEVRYPYLDRRLLEFALAIPLEQKLRVGETRSIVRRALRDQIPAAVLQRRTKTGPTEAFQRALLRERRWIDALFEKPLLEDLGIVDSQRFRKTLHHARHGLARSSGQMHRTLSLELWLRSLVAQGHSISA